MEESYTSPFSNDVQNGTRSFVVGLFTGPPPSALQPRMGFGPTAWRAGGNTKTAPFFQITPEVSTLEQLGPSVYLVEFANKDEWPPDLACGKHVFVGSAGRYSTDALLAHWPG